MFHTEKTVLDFKAEEKKAQSAVFEIEDIISDSSTISASEMSIGDNTPTPALLCKLRKPRIMIKKLPKHILEKYNLNSEKSTTSSSTKPSRVSKRMGGKNVPGLYLSLHVNKPLSEVLNPKKRRRRHFLHTAKPATIEKSVGCSNRNPKQFVLNSNQKKILQRPSTGNRLSAAASSLCTRTSLNEKSHLNKNIAAQLPNSSGIISIADSSSASKNGSSLHGRIAASAKINRVCNLNRPVVSTLPNFPDVVITKYAMPQNNSPDTPQDPPSVNNQPRYMAYQMAPVVPTLTPNSYKNFRMISVPQHNITVQVSPSSHVSNYANFSQIQNSSTPVLHQNLGQPVVVDAAVTDTSENFLSGNHKQKTASQQTTTAVQTITIPTKLTTQNNPIIVDSSKILVIKQPSLKNDPLDMPESREKGKRKPETQQQNKENIAEDSDIETCVESESDFEMSDTEHRTEPEVIKRIIYHTKSVQTKFTCNGAICGLVDSDGFKLNCFYCYKIFPLHKWQEFKEHIKLVHHVEEKENKSDSEEEEKQEEKNIKSQVHKEISTIDLTTKPLNSNGTSATTEPNHKKLPLEPRLVAERLKKMAAEQSKSLSNTLKNLAKLKKYVNESNDSKQSSMRHSSTNHLNSSTFDEIVSLNSDDGGDDIVPIADDEFENVAKGVQQVQENSSNNNKNSTITSQIDEVAKLLPPSLQHITIKKVEKVPSKETEKLIPVISKPQQQSLLKFPPNLHIQRVIKTEQLTANGHTKPRYFVVKKVVKPASTILPNISKGMILTKMSESGKGKNDDDMPSNDENEDTVPKPTNGCGILFGLTNPMVVIEFLLKLKTFPELWRPQLTKNSSSVTFDDSMRKLCLHLNNRFDLDIQAFEMRLSIQRVKDWYCRMLKEIYEHNKNPNNTEPYKHKFPLYFKILNQFLTSDVHYTNNLLLSSRFKSDTTMNKYPKWMVYKTETSSNAKPNLLQLNDRVSKEDGGGGTERESFVHNNFKSPSTPPTTTPAEPSAEANAAAETTTIIETAASDINVDNLIEFDADTLYDHESSDEEILEAFDETKVCSEEINKIEMSMKKRTKVYTGHYECDLCPKAYKRRCDIERHRVHHFPPEYECGVCEQKFYFKHWAEKCNHLRSKTYRLKTIKAEKTPKQQEGAGTDVKRVWPKKIFRHKLICELCGASYRQIGSLNCHKRDKHFNQRLKCIVCHFTALTNYRIVQHQKKRHIVEPGTVEEVAKKSRARTETKTRFSTEARQEFDWRREMRKKLKPGEKFYACCKCRIIFNTRKEKVLHNKMEHPIKETTVVCLLCLPTKFLLSNSNSARRHYTDIHKIPWDEIDALVKRTKPIFNVLSKEEIELLNASENYKELLEEFLKDRKLEPIEKVEETQAADEALNAVQNLPNIISGFDEGVQKAGVESTQDEEYVYVDGIIDHDYNSDYNKLKVAEEVYNEQEEEYADNYNKHDYNEEQTSNENYNSITAANEQSNNQLYVHRHHHNDVINSICHLNYDIQHDQHQHPIQEDQEYLETIVDDFVEGELVDGQLVEECIVVEEEFVEV